MTNDGGKRIRLSGWLASHYQTDEMPAWMVKNNYDAAVNIINNPTKFPKANIELVSRLMDELFELDPIAVYSGI